MENETYEMCRTAFQAAQSFHTVGMRCLHPEPGLSIEPFPMIVNIAFACELYLKVGLIASGLNAAGHDLDILFRRLPQSDQEQIETIYDAEAKQDHIPLRNTLPEIGKAFVEWRYAYERATSGVRHGALLRLAQSLMIWTSRNYPQLPPDRARFEVLRRI